MHIVLTQQCSRRVALSSSDPTVWMAEWRDAEFGAGDLRHAAAADSNLLPAQMGMSFLIILEVFKFVGRKYKCVSCSLRVPAHVCSGLACASMWRGHASACRRILRDVVVKRIVPADAACLSC